MVFYLSLGCNKLHQMLNESTSWWHRGKSTTRKTELFRSTFRAKSRLSIWGWRKETRRFVSRRGARKSLFGTKVDGCMLVMYSNEMLCISWSQCAKTRGRWYDSEALYCSCGGGWRPLPRGDNTNKTDLYSNKKTQWQATMATETITIRLPGKTDWGMTPMQLRERVRVPEMIARSSMRIGALIMDLP